jgi:putative endonuclease
MSNQSNYGVYIMLCQDGSYYVGASNDVEHRINAHLAGVGSKYTRSKGSHAVKCVFWLGGLPDWSAAYRAEAFIKAGGRGLKDLLATGHDAFRYTLRQYALHVPSKSDRNRKKKEVTE